MIFKRTLQSELIFYSCAVYAALTLVTLTFTLIRLLTQAVDGRIDPQTVFILLGFALVNFQAIVLSLSVFIGTLLVFGRLWRDSEMTIWQASGLSLRRFVWPTLRFAIPLALLAGLFGLMIAPWANLQAFEYRKQYEKRDDLSRLATQQFKENSDHSRIFYVGNVDESSRSASNLFIVERLRQQPNTENIVASKQGRIVSNDQGDRYLELNQGRRYQIASLSAANTAGSKAVETRLMTYEQYSVLLAESPQIPSADVPVKLKGTLELLTDHALPARAELLWRFSTTVMLVFLALLAVPLSYFNPRSGRSSPMVVSVLLFLIYISAIKVMEGNVLAGKVKPFIALIAPHLVVLLIALLLLLWRSQWFYQHLGRWLRALRKTLRPSQYV